MSDGYICSECEFKLWNPIRELEASYLGLYDDARFPGRCILVLKRHETDFFSLDVKETITLLDDAKKAASAIRRVTSTQRTNFAVLGNVEPHLHAHLIPRRDDEGPHSRLPPWQFPEKIRRLDPGDLTRLTLALRDELSL